MATFLTNALFQTIILPFLLAFTLIFALLEKSKLLGEGKQQINAIISFVIAAFLIYFSNAVDIITQMMVFLAIALAVLFVFMLLFAFVWGTTKGDPFENAQWLKWVLGIGALVATIIAVLYVTNKWDMVINYLSDSTTGSNIFFAVIIIGAIAAVILSGGKGKKE
jgi:hypothetical protein